MLGNIFNRTQRMLLITFSVPFLRGNFSKSVNNLPDIWSCNPLQGYQRQVWCFQLCIFMNSFYWYSIGIYDQPRHINSSESRTNNPSLQFLVPYHDICQCGVIELCTWHFQTFHAICRLIFQISFFLKKLDHTPCRLYITIYSLSFHPRYELSVNLDILIYNTPWFDPSLT